MVLHRRDLFWQNVLREMLNGLAAAAAMSAGRLSATPSGAAHGGSPTDSLFDGRLAVITRLGHRIPVADVVPMFACSVPYGNRADRSLADDVQCTVYQVRTPNGEVHTLPLSEISSIHTLSEKLIQTLQEAAQAQLGPRRADTPARPFGFGAFTSLAHSEQSRRDD
jgi:hypothetical protein